jgi:hypothetical protein
MNALTSDTTMATGMARGLIIPKVNHTIQFTENSDTVTLGMTGFKRGANHRNGSVKMS